MSHDNASGSATSNFGVAPRMVINQVARTQWVMHSADMAVMPRQQDEPGRSEMTTIGKTKALNMVNSEGCIEAC